MIFMFLKNKFISNESINRYRYINYLFFNVFHLQYIKVTLDHSILNLLYSMGI